MSRRVDAEASGCLVVPPVFKTGGRRAASSAGSIPVRLRDALAWVDAQPRSGERRASAVAAASTAAVHTNVGAAAVGLRRLDPALIRSIRANTSAQWERSASLAARRPAPGAASAASLSRAPDPLVSARPPEARREP